MFIISFCLAADASILIFNPSLYRKSLDYINESMGPIWGVLYGLLFAFCAIFVLISIVFSGVSVFYILSAIAMACLALFFLMIGTEKYSHFASIWSSLSDIQYRIAGIIFVVLATIVCYITACLR
ncbi:MAG: hypothetical protein JXA96_04490 [Sedimentisphaerales bacterium]|nr:hypothetical protein [Sedimentisphaerales bacterium]